MFVEKALCLFTHFDILLQTVRDGISRTADRDSKSSAGVAPDTSVLGNVAQTPRAVCEGWSTRPDARSAGCGDQA